jgi:hypothetical protein
MDSSLFQHHKIQGEHDSNHSVVEQAENLVTPPPDPTESTITVLEPGHWDAHLQTNSFTDGSNSGPIDNASSLSTVLHDGCISVASVTALTLSEEAKSILFVH